MTDMAWRLLTAWPATIAIETAVLAAFLSPRHRTPVRLFAGAWLSGCTLPVVWLVLPDVLRTVGADSAYLVVAEVFAPLAECGLFWWVFLRPLPPDGWSTVRDCSAIVMANLASFALGEAVWRLAGFS